MKVFLAILLILFIAGLFFPPMLVIFLLAVVAFLVFVVIRRLTMPKEKLQKIREENAVKLEEAKAKREQAKLERERRNRERIRDNTPVAAVVITAQDKTKTTGGLGSAVVGGMIAGPVGAVVGASVGKKKTQVTGQRVTFSVKYESGRTGVETVDVTSKRFRELSALLMK